MLLTSPLMLLGLLAIPALVGVYWLRSRSRRAVVSSLVFWTDQRRPRQGGRIFDRMQTPLTFFLELLALALLAVAAAGPAILQKDVARPLVVVLNDSYSMLASPDGDQRNSSRHRAEAALIEELQRDRYVTRLVVAGSQPRLLGEPSRELAEVRETLEKWTCQTPTSDLTAAIALAAEVGGPAARILVLTDHEPAMPLDAGQVQWWAFGQPLPNIAFTAATRTRLGDEERVLLEVANLSDEAGATTLTLEGGNLESARKSDVELAAGATRQFFLNLPGGSPPLKASLGDDALAIDNHVLLLADSAKPLRVRIDLANEALRRAVTRALDATGLTVEVTDRPELIIADKFEPMDGDAWRWEFFGAKEATAYTGPFVIDHNHPLAEGISLQNVIWSALPKNAFAGLPIVMAGNVPLMCDREDVVGRHLVQTGFAVEQSNVQNMPDWPILFANMVQWRRANLPGVASPNVRLGQNVSVTLDRDAAQLEIISPGKPSFKLEVHGRHATMPADQVGLHAFRVADLEYPFACNAISRDTSELRDCQFGRWGDWTRSPIHQDRQVSLAWGFLLVALGAMAAHAWIVARNAGGRET